MNKQQCITILGSTGSIGTSTLDVLSLHPESYRIHALTASSQVDLMLAQCARFKPEVAVMVQESAGRQLAERVRAEGLSVQVRWGAAALDFHALSAMTFEAMDEPEHRLRYPGIALAWETLRGAPGSCAVLNAANEVAVDAFLNKRIRFDQIQDVNRATLDRLAFEAPDSLEALLALDAASRSEASRLVLAQ